MKFFLLNAAILLSSIAGLTTSQVAAFTNGPDSKEAGVPQPTADRIDHEGIGGVLVIAGGGNVPEDALKQFVEAAVRDRGEGKDHSVVILSQAAEDPAAAAAETQTWLTQAGVINVVVSQASADNTESIAATAEQIRAATGVWIGGGQQSRLSELFAGTAVETELIALLSRGGVVGGTSAGAAIMSKQMIASGTTEPTLSTGFDLLPGAIIDQHFKQRDRVGRSRLAVAAHPELFGLGIDEDTAVIVTQRSLDVVGTGNATVLLASSPHRSSEEMVLSSGQTADLTQLRRAARSRASGVDPGVPVFGPTQVDSGALVIVGGGGMPKPIVDRFIELAGGADARIVVLPTAVPRDEAFRQRVPGFFRDAGVAEVRILPQSRTAEVESEEFQEALRSATGIWFGGGRQWNFVDAYEGTTAVELFRDVLRRGGVIGGSSAGATIQGEFLVRGHPLGNTVMMAEGYERGFAFLPGSAIDQHFSQRGRKPDLIPVIRRHPKLVGIGIDESTAIVVKGTTAEVIGDHSAHFLTANRLPPEADGDLSKDQIDELYVSVPTGKSIDLEQLFSKDAATTEQK